MEAKSVAGSVTQRATRYLFDALQSYGSTPNEVGKFALQVLLEAFTRCLEGRLSQNYWLSSLDPGVGKSCAVSAFLRAWKDENWKLDGSALIGLSRLDEIDKLVGSAGLSRSDFGVFTTSDPHNDLGVPQGQLQDARVLFTTQQMITSRTRDRAFELVDEFFYQGKPRSLRIWDESLIPGEYKAITIDDLSFLGLLRTSFGDYVEAVDELRDAIREAGEGATIALPEAFAKAPTPTAKTTPDPSVRAKQEDIIEKLAILAGRKVAIASYAQTGLALVGEAPGLPADFAPAVILDASGRVRKTYDLWEQHRGGLARLPAATNDYGNLQIFVWQRASGRMALRDPETRRQIVEAIAGLINRDLESRWLMIHYKEDTTFISDLNALVFHRPEDRVYGLSWGRHTGTNAFKDIRNIVLVGQNTYPQCAFYGYALASAGVPVERLGDLNVTAIRWGEYQHHLLQAVCRGAVRKAQDGVAPDCHVYLITTPARSLKERIAQTFPGCLIGEWGPDPVRLTGKAQLASEYLLEAMADPECHRVRKSEVSDFLEMRKPNFRNHVIRHPQFQRFMAENAITEDGQWFYFGSLFDEIEGGFSVDSLNAELLPKEEKEPISPLDL